MTIGLVPWELWILLLVVLAHAPSGANWVASSVLLQKRTVDSYRGRVFSSEWLLITLAIAVGLQVRETIAQSETPSPAAQTEYDLS